MKITINPWMLSGYAVLAIKIYIIYMTLTEQQYKIWEILKKVFLGNEINGKTILVSAGIKSRGQDGADLRSIIHALRVKGHPICANGRGYYVAKSKKEIDEYCTQLDGRARQMSEALVGLRTSTPLLKLEQQTKVWEL